MFLNPTWFSPALAPVEMTIGLSHLDLDFCWCDPIVEVDEERTQNCVPWASNVELSFSGRWNPKTLPERRYLLRRTIQVRLPAKR